MMQITSAIAKTMHPVAILARTAGRKKPVKFSFLKHDTVAILINKIHFQPSER